MTFSPTAVAARKFRASEALKPFLKEMDLVVVSNGDPLQKPGGLDQTYPFLPHPDYFWLTGERHPHGISVYTLAEGWMDFIMPSTRNEALWEGSVRETQGHDVREFEKWLQKKNPKRVASLGMNPNRFFTSVWAADKDLTDSIQLAFDAVRRVKDGEEIALIKKCADFALAGYKKFEAALKPGITELELKIEFETAALKAGAEKFPYETIVGAGVKSATLHAIPAAKKVNTGEIVLIDAGADVDDYCVDITRVFAVDGKFTSRQQQIYDLVLKAQTNSIEKCLEGVEWYEVHETSARTIAEGLISLKILKGTVDSAIETGAISVFLPHGVGHMVGLRVRDVGGIKGKASKKYCGVNLRCDFALQNGFLMTVEPGCYFVPALLNDEEIKKQYADQIDWNEAEKWKDFGGVRIEDDIHITKDGPQNLTTVVPK
jgi:Xaa-Pro dipeptidase